MTEEPSPDNLEEKEEKPSRPLWHWAAFVAGGVLLVGLIFVGWTAFRVWAAWRDIPRIEFDLPQSREALGQAGASGSATTVAPPAGQYDAYLILGSDEHPDKPGVRADSIILFLRPHDGSDNLLISIPRDLYLPSPCTGEPVKISVNLEGCGTRATGIEALAIAVEDFTGLEIEHVVLFGFEGFVRVIDRLGGIEVCTEFPIRRTTGGPIEVPTGCSFITGDTALWWVRARDMQGFIDGNWEVIFEGDGDRTRRQRTVLIQMMQRMSQYRSITGIENLAIELSDAVVIDDSLGLGEAVGLAWDLRDLSSVGILQPELGVEPDVSPDGEFILVPTQSFASLLAAAQGGQG